MRIICKAVNYTIEYLLLSSCANVLSNHFKIERFSDI